MTITLDSLTVTTGSGGTTAVLKIHNSSGSVTLSELTVAVRDSANNNLDYPDLANVTVGTSVYTYTQTKTFANGTYTMFGAYQTSDGVWHSLASQTVVVGGDTTPPSSPTNLADTFTANVLLTWTASTDNVGVAGYYVYRNGTQIANVTSGTSYTDSGRPLNTAYTYTVKAYDAAGNVSGASNSLSVTTPNTGSGGGDTTPPSVPTGLASSNVAQTSLTLSWTASTDNVGVAGYHVFRGGTQVATVTGTSFNDTGLTAGTAYSYTVNAYDAAGNTSAQSSALSVTTSAASGPGTRVIGGVTKNNVFWDDFASGSLDTSKWSLNNTSSYPGNGPTNCTDNKVDYFHSGSLSFSGSNIVFTATDSGFTQSSDGNGSFYDGAAHEMWYTAFISTENVTNGFQVQTGDYLETKCVLPNPGVGAWPALWTWANGNGEVDVFEWHPDGSHPLELTNHVANPAQGSYDTNAADCTAGNTVTIGAYMGASSVDWYVNGTKVYSDNVGVGSGFSSYINLNLSLAAGNYGHVAPNATVVFTADYVGVWR